MAIKVRLQAQARLLIDMHGGVRSAAREIGLDAGYLSRLASGEKNQPSEGVLERLGLQRHVYYTRKTSRVESTHDVRSMVPKAG